LLNSMDVRVDLLDNYPYNFITTAKRS